MFSSILVILVCLVFNCKSKAFWHKIVHLGQKKRFLKDKHVRFLRTFVPLTHELIIMKKHLLVISLSALMLFGCGGNNQQQQTSNTDAAEVEAEVQVAPMSPVYVLSDQFGTKFLLQADFEGNVAPEAPDNLSRYKYIVYNDQYYPVRFKGAQLENKEENNYRDTYYNFDNLSGWLYEMQEGKLLENPENEYDAIWGAALLVDENYKNTSTILGLKNRENGMTKVVALSDDLQKAFENKYGRKIVTSCASAVFGDNSEYQLVNVQFENKGDDALGVTALVENGEIKAVKEFPATYDETSTWRVDDEGEFNGLWADLVTLENGVLTIYTADSGAEGCNYQNYVVKEDSLIEGNVSTSLYQAPM